MEYENFIIDRNGKAKSMKEIIFIDSLKTIPIEKKKPPILINAKSSKIILKLKNLNPGNIRQADMTTEKNKLEKSKFNTSVETIPKKVSDQTSQSLQSILPAIQQNIHRRNHVKNHTSINGEKFKKVEGLFRTEMRLKHNIKKSINSKSIVLENKPNDIEDEKLVEDNLMIDYDKEAGNIVKELFCNIKSQSSQLDSKQVTAEEKRISKKNKVRFIRRKGDYSVINGKFTYFTLVNDNELMCKIFVDNMSKINNLIENSENSKRNKILESFKL